MTDEQRTTAMGKARFNVSQRPEETSVPLAAKVILIASGKGGVGKSSVTVNLAAALAARGLTVGVLDADIWGFSVPRMLGVEGRLAGVAHEGRKQMTPIERRIGDGVVRVVSMGLLVDDEETALMWRGLMLNRGVQHFLQDVRWGDDLDYLLIDMPPGTGDVQMGVAKLIPRAEVIVVTTPARAAQKVAIRAVGMARKSFLRVAGVIENMSAFHCDHGETYALFGEGGGQQLATDAGVPLLGEVPLEPAVSAGRRRRHARWRSATGRPPRRSGRSPTTSSTRPSRWRPWPGAAPACSTRPWPPSTLATPPADAGAGSLAPLGPGSVGGVGGEDPLRRLLGRPGQGVVEHARHRRGPQGAKARHCRRSARPIDRDRPRPTRRVATGTRGTARPRHAPSRRCARGTRGSAGRERPSGPRGGRGSAEASTAAGAVICHRPSGRARAMPSSSRIAGSAASPGARPSRSRHLLQGDRRRCPGPTDWATAVRTNASAVGPALPGARSSSRRMAVSVSPCSCRSRIASRRDRCSASYMATRPARRGGGRSPSDWYQRIVRTVVRVSSATSSTVYSPGAEDETSDVAAVTSAQVSGATDANGQVADHSPSRSSPLAAPSSASLRRCAHTVRRATGCSSGATSA